jgi:hypothetical protein
MLTSIFLYSLWKTSPFFRERCKEAAALAGKVFSPHGLLVLTCLFSIALLLR